MAYFLKKTKSSPSRGLGLKIYFSYRDPETKKPTNKQYKNCGYVNDLIAAGDPDPIATVLKEVEELNAEWNEQKKQKKKKLIDTVAPETHIGYLPLERITERLDVKTDLDYFQQNRKFQFNVFDTMMNLVYARVCHPASKKKTYEDILPTLFNKPDISYDQILSCLDFIGQNYEKYVEAFTYHVNETYVLDTDSTFFDCTNFYFEIDREDEWRRKGPSKEKRSDPILGMGLLLDNNTIPIGMKLFPGNQSEKPVLREVIRELRNQNNISGRTIQIADKGLNCARNIIDAVGAGDGYIFSKSVKGATQAVRDWAIDKEGFVTIPKENTAGRSSSAVCQIKSRKIMSSYSYKDENGRKHCVTVPELQIVTFNSKLYAKQTEEIQRQVDKASGLCLCQAKKAEFGDSAKYVQFKAIDKKTGEEGDEKVVPELNLDAIQKAFSCAGYNMLITSETEMNPLTVFEKYHELWRIEETFRCMKSQLQARPVYLQIPERIHGHFLICYLGVLLERIFQYKVLKNNFGSEKVYDFIRKTKVIKIDEYRYLNVSTRKPVIEYITKNFNVPLMNYYLKPSELAKIYERVI